MCWIPYLEPGVFGADAGNLVYAIAPELPVGLIFCQTDGAISGKPTALSSLTECTVTATLSGGAGEGSDSYTFSLALGESAKSVTVSLGTPRTETLTAAADFMA